MKKIMLLVLGSFLFLNAIASTDINTSVVSGHWTVSGSPYKIYNDFSINSILTIDSGVSVVFQGGYRITASGSGQLICHGSPSMPIVFDYYDSAAWSANAGGWGGIFLDSYNGTAPDSSVLDYCYFYHLQNSPIWVFRSIPIKNSVFSQNRGRVLSLKGGESGNKEVSNCKFSNNKVDGQMVYVFPMTTKWYFHDNEFSYNSLMPGASVFTSYCGELLFSRNELHHNAIDTFISGALDVKIFQLSAYNTIPTYAVFNNNKVYENTSLYSAAVFVDVSVVDISNNYICNNHSVAVAHCANSYGGGGLALFGDGDYYNSMLGNNLPALYVLRNNIIANNYSALYGGGVYLFNAKAIVANNTIVNNKAPRGGGIDCWMTDPVSLCVKNNIFLGNINEASSNGVGDIHLVTASTTNLRYDHNWAKFPYSKDVNVGHAAGTVEVLSDTNSNIIGSDPGLVAPTINPDYNESALSADFSLLNSSPCIDNGSSGAVTSGYSDFAGNLRVVGSSVDIGALENGSSTVSSLSVTPTDTIFTKCCAKIDFNFLSIQEIRSTGKGMNIFPNPASIVVFVQTPEATGVISILDAIGREVMNEPVNSNLTSFDLHCLPKGMYYAMWDSGTGMALTQKIILE